MKLLNPWIDPRVLQVKPADAEKYLIQRGWQQVKPYSRNLTAYSRPGDGEEGSFVYVPLVPDAPEYPQRMIELVAALALEEDRYAVETLNDILQLNNVSVSGNGQVSAHPPAPAVVSQ